MTMDLHIGSLLLLLGLAGGTIFLVFAGYSIYNKLKQSRIWSRIEADLDEPQNDTEKAAFEQCALPPDTNIEFIEPEGDAGSDPGDTAKWADEVSKDAIEMAAVGARREREIKQSTLDYDGVPTGQEFTDLDGFKYKFVKNPNYDPCITDKGDGRSRVRTKLKLSGAVTNAAAIPMPTPVEMEKITKRQALESTTLVGAENPLSLDLEDENDSCAICGSFTDHNHTGAELRRAVYERSERQFNDWAEALDLTKLGPEAVQRLLARCKIFLFDNAGLKEMQSYDDLLLRAQDLARADAEDTAFFMEALKEAETIRRAEILKARGKVCGNCEDLTPEDMDEGPENCGCPHRASDLVGADNPKAEKRKRVVKKKPVKKSRRKR
jgi:hypothetical protein